MSRLSVALAVYNEEENISKCLKSVEGIADEIVVVDGGSIDRTVEIAKSFGAKVIQTDNPPIFHINKQKALDACLGEWILQLDADEIATPELRTEVKRTIKQPNNKTVGFYIPRRNYLLGKWLRKGGAYPDYVIRLFKNGKGRFPCKSVHEQIEIGGEVGYLESPLTHNPYPTFSEYLRKMNIYTSLTARDMLDKKIPINVLNTLNYLAIKPKTTFLSLYLRHKGFLDGFPGFVWAFFSGIHYPIAYIKYWEKKSTA